MDVLDVVRIIFGSIFILFVPGFAWSYVFFRGDKIDWIERFALSFGLSIAIVPLTVFWLNWLFDVNITLLSTTLMVCGITVVALLWLLARKLSWTGRLTNRARLQFRSLRGRR